VRALVASTTLIALAYAAAFLPGGAPRWAAISVALGTSGAYVSILVLGAARADRGIGRLGWVFGFLFALLSAAFTLVFTMPSEGASAPLWLGLPPRAAIVLYGIGILPLFVLPIAYALTFDTRTLSDEDIRRVREAGRAARERAP
jgi:hypothetical protein